MNIIAKRSSSEPLPLFTASVRPDPRRAKAYICEHITRAAAGPITEDVWITPELAGELLARNESNRVLNDATVERYATDMRDDAWTLDGEAIKLSIDGKLIDGQHRCSAIIKSGMPVRSFVIFGLPAEARVTMDQGRARTAGDYIRMEHGDHDPNTIASAAGFLWAWENRKPMSSRGVNGATKAQIMAVRERHPGLIDSAKSVRQVNAKRKLSRSELVFFHYLASRVSSTEAATTFVYLICTGDKLATTDTIYRYRERILTTSLGRGERIELLFRTWNKWRQKGRSRGGVQLLGELPDLVP